MIRSASRSLLDALAGDPEIEALLSDSAKLQSMLAFETALGEASAEVGFVSDASASRIVEVASRFKPDWDALVTAMKRDGLIVPALVTQFRAALGEKHAADFHRGATSQDVIDTALMLQMSRVIDVLEGRLHRLQVSLAAMAERDGKQPLVAHTRMQSALAFTVADKVRTWVEPLDRHRRALAAMRDDIFVIQLGGPVGDRSSFGGLGEEIARGMARRLRLGIAAPWHSNRDRIVQLGNWMSMVCGTLGKFGADVALMAQTEVAAITLMGGGTSSSMPHKNNPVGAEVLVALARYSGGLAGTLQHAMVHENERSGSAWTLEWLTMPPLAITTGAALETAQELAGALDFNEST